ncbi:MAG TPA: DUF5818 domain-containing protein [Terracidiphilus sp.]|nr:DUF5818 domain-containing protein [Terracidiphilus sp.]
MRRFATVLAACAAFGVLAAQAATTHTGWISDSMCGAKHMGTGAECVRSCIKNGMKPVFVDTNKKVWAIDNPNAVRDFYGDHVKVSGTEHANNSVHVDSISAVK